MSESPQKFTIERREASPLSALEVRIEKLYSEARHADDPEVFDTLYSDVAFFSESLQSTFAKDELLKVPAYHRLVRSGLPTHEPSVEEGLATKRREEIEGAIEAFVEEKLKALQKH